MKEIADRLTPLSPEAFVLALMHSWASYFGRGPKARQLACVVAQLVLETGRRKQPDGTWLWGQGYAEGLGAHNFNWGNIKHKGSSDPNDFQFFECAEWLWDPKTKKSVFHRFKPRHPQCKFRAYETAEEGFSDYLRFLIRRRNGVYLKAWNEGVHEGDPIRFSHELGAAGYYTAPIPKYTRTLVSLFSDVLPVCQQVISSPEGRQIFGPEEEREDEKTLETVSLSIWQSLRELHGDAEEISEDAARESLAPNVPEGP